jgi:hypothetical protein
VKKSLVTIVASAGLLSACSQVPAGQQALEIDSFGAPTISNCVKEESQVGTMTVDLRRFPARQITWDANNDPGAERGPYTAMSKPQSPPLKDGEVAGPDYSTGQAEMAIPMTIVFDMTTNCDELKQFYRDYATQDQGWLNDDGSVSDGWKKMLTRIISQPAEQAVIGITQKYPWQKIWNDETVRVEYKDALQARLPKEAAARTGGKEYFRNFVVNVGKPYPTDDRLKSAAASIQSAQAEADATRTKLTAEANAARDAAVAQQAAAEAQKNAEIAKAQLKAAEIGGYPNPDIYLRDRCIDKGESCGMFNPPTVIAAPTAPTR